MISAKTCQNGHTLAQNNLCEFWCGMHPTCKNNPVIPDRKRLMNRSEKDHEESISRPLLDAIFHLTKSLPPGQVENRLFENSMVVLRLATSHCRKWTWKSRYVTVISREIRMYCGRFVGPSLTVHGWSPCLWNLETVKVEVLHLFRWFTHTPCCRSAFFLEDATVSWNKALIRSTGLGSRNQNARNKMNYRNWKHIKDSETKGENGLDLVQNVRDVLEVTCLNITCLNMLGQNLLFSGENIRNDPWQLGSLPFPTCAM